MIVVLRRLNLNQRGVGSKDRTVGRVQEFQILGPHHLHIADGAGAVQHDQEILKQLKVFLEFLLEHTAKSGFRTFHSLGTSRGFLIGPGSGNHHMRENGEKK